MPTAWTFAPMGGRKMFGYAIPSFLNLLNWFFLASGNSYSINIK